MLCKDIVSARGSANFCIDESPWNLDGRGSDVDINNWNSAGVRAFCDTKLLELKMMQ